MLKIVTASGVRQIVVSGMITPDNNTASQIIAAIKEQMVYGAEVELLLQNCYGGSVHEGILAYNAVKEAGINTRVEGLCASMGTILFCGGKERIMGRMSQLMIHAPMGGAEGGADQMRSAADHLDKLTESFAAVYAEVTGLDAKKVAKQWLDGTDHYLSADEALACGLATKVVDGAVKTAIPEGVLKMSNVKAVASYFENQIVNLNNQIIIMKKIHLFIAAFAATKLPNMELNQEATEDQLLDKTQKLAEAFVAISAKLEAVEAKAAADHSAAVTALIDEAVKDKKITEDLRATYTAFAKNDFAGAQKAIAAIKVISHIPVASKVNNTSGSPDAGTPKCFQISYKEAVAKSDAYVNALKDSDADTFGKWKAAYDKPLV